MPSLWSSEGRRRILAVVTVLALIAPLQLLHRCALWVDQLLFPGFRRVNVVTPLFIVGPPRSGTTLLHRLIATDSEQFTTFPLWELLFAPAICQKYFWLALYRIDRIVGGPLAWLIRRVESIFTRRLAQLHPTSLQSPEEDYLSLLWCSRGCFLLVLLFPRDQSVWNLGHFDAAVDPALRARVLREYKSLLQRHLYVRGPERFFLSKNPSFSSWIGSLLNEFPDARFIALWRPADKTLPSQLSSLRDGLRLFGNHAADPRLVERFVELFVFYYVNLDATLQRNTGSAARRMSYAELIADPLDEVREALLQLGYSLTDTFLGGLAAAAERARGYRSNHRYSLEEFGLTTARLRQRMSELFECYRHQCERSPDILFFGRNFDSATHRHALVARR